MKLAKLLSLVIVTVLVAALLVTPATAQEDEELVFGLAAHNALSGSFWGVVERGAQDAAEDLGITLLANGSVDPVEQARFVEDYVAQDVDGIIVSLANADAMADAIQSALDAGIPVISMNSGVNDYQELGILTHVGQTESVAGRGAGLRFNGLGPTKVLCVIDEEANVAYEERCAGLEETFEGEVERFNVASTGIQDLAGTQATIEDKLISDDTIDGILTLNPDIGIAALDAMAGAGTEQVLATFDLSPAVLDAVEAGDIAFAIDQQQYLQGYLPVVLLQLFNENLNVVGGGEPVLTGPGFVDASNAATVKDLSDAGTR